MSRIDETGTMRCMFSATVRESLSGLVDLLFPLRCAGCDSTGIPWCADCATELTALRRIERAPMPPRPPVYALGRYRTAARRAVLAYKESGRRDLAVPFGNALAAGIKAITTARDMAGPWYLIPAPSRRIQSRRRGGAHMTRVARRTAVALGELGKPSRTADCLVIGSGARDSVGLDAAARIRNLSENLSPLPGRHPPPGAPVILLDDVITTGATVASCVTVLHAEGIEPEAVLSLTATA